LRSLGAIRQYSTHWLIREAIQEYFSEEKEIEALDQEAAAAWKDY
jgi:hypothetical protein